MIGTLRYSYTSRRNSVGRSRNLNVSCSRLLVVTVSAGVEVAGAVGDGEVIVKKLSRRARRSSVELGLAEKVGGKVYLRRSRAKELRRQGPMLGRQVE